MLNRLRDIIKKLAWIEFVRGFCATISLISTIRWYVVPVSILSGLLWMIGGTYWKGFRRFGVPLIALCTFIIFHHLTVLRACFIGFFGTLILSLGDGYPDSFSKDEGSWLGRQVKKLGLSDSVGGEITKWIPVLLFQLALIPMWLS